MSTAGEAASLFGEPDVSLDPFSAVLGGDSPRDDHNSNNQPTNAVSDLFGSSTDVFPIDGAGSLNTHQTNEQQAWYDPAGQPSYGYDNAATARYSQAYQAQSSHAQKNGTYPQYDPYSQGSAYSQNAAPSSSAPSAYEPSYSHQQGYASQPYAPYAQNVSAYAPAPAAQPAIQNGTYAPPASYDPYKPAQTLSTYDVSSHTANAPISPAYDAYKSPYAAPPNSQQSYSYGTDLHTPAYGSPPVTVPPPPVPISSAPPPPPAASVSHYRPKTSNAYDPPLPPIKAKYVAIPPRQAYNSPPPMSPPPRTTLTPQSLPPPPRRTPDPHTVPIPPRRDSHPPVPPVPSKYVPTGPQTPSAVNGVTHHSAPQPSHDSTSHYGAAGASGIYGGVGQAKGAYHHEGLPKVNDTYAPPTYSYDQHAQASVDDVFNTQPDEAPPPVEYASPVANTLSDLIASPVHETIPEVDEETLQTSGYGSTQNLDAPVFSVSSPPTSAEMYPNGAPTWLDSVAHSPPNHGPPSPEKARSPPRATNAVIPSGQASTSAYDPYAPTSKSGASDRAKSPSASSVRSIPRQNYDPSGRRDSAPKLPPINRPLSSQSRRSTFSNNSYEAPVVPDLKRTTSPSGSIRSINAPKQSAYDPYAPAEKPVGPSAAHGRNTSNGSTYSTTSVVDPYAPVRHPTRQSSEHLYGSFALPSEPASYVPTAPPAPTYDRMGGQVVTLAAPIHSSYAPSPSLLGTNDPLGRTSARVPVISFGFGGKLVTCFHGASMNTGFDVALSARQSTDIKIHFIHKVIPESALDTSAAYPGPLYSDPGSPTASLVRTGAQVLKAKKARVIKYLEERAEEIKGGLGYHRPGSVDKSSAEAKYVLVMLLKVMVENDGRLSGTNQIDAAVRAALAPPDGATSSSDAAQGGSGMIPATSTEHLSTYASMSSALPPNTQDHIVSKTAVRSSQLDKLQDLLARGDRRGACHYAADERLWSHALLIASSIDKECWKDVVTEWVRAELVSDVANSQDDGKSGRESLRVAYSLFSGNGAEAVQELVHPSSLLQHSQSTLQVPQPQQLSITPMTPNFPTVQRLNITQEVLTSWAKTAAMILSNPMTPESSAALTALGDQLAAQQWIEAAHACYLLSPRTSPLASMGSNPRLILLGSPPPSASPIYYKDPDPIILSEIAEFAMALAPPSKGQEPFLGLPNLQPYRLIRATYLAEIGHVQAANRYCEAIAACANRGSSVTFLEQLKGLSDRLTAAPQLDKSGSWITSKMAKPSLDSIGNWLVTKFMEGDSPLPEVSKGLEHQQSYSGPFANYSSISSATTSAYPSPHQSVTDLTEVPSGSVPPPPFRTGSAMGARPPSRSHMQINRASSAMDHVRPFQRRGSPIARVASASAATFADAASNGQARTPHGNGYGLDQAKAGSYTHGDVSTQGHSKPPSTSSWWGPSESDVATPTASSFVHLDDQPGFSTSNSGFISLMDSSALSANVTPTGMKQVDSASSLAAPHDFDDDDDLGLGNSSSRRKVEENSDTAEGATVKQEEKPKLSEAEKSDAKQAASSGWLSRLWKRGDSTSSTPSAVKANLGEESSFYFDKELGKWVNKTSGAKPEKPSPTPPPPRAQTASPGRSFGAGPPPPSPLGPPPARPATSNANLTHEPPRRPPTRIRSNLVPSDVDGGPSVPPSPMPPSGTPPPPGNGPPPAGKAKTGKRNVRSRYVDVFQQEGAGSS